MTRRLVYLCAVAMVCLYGAPADAQDAAVSDPPAHISFVDGSAVLERDGQPESAPSSMPLLAGDRLRTQGGRVEVLFADGSALHLDANTVIDLQSDEVVRLLEGRIRLSIAGPNRTVAYRVDAPSAWVQINDPGEYRIAVIRSTDVELGVLRGAAELVNEDGRSFIRAGERTFARDGAAPSPPYVFNSAAWDAFDRWSEARRDQRLGVSAQYLPNDVRPYAATLDTYGSWSQEPEYGYVWYPRVEVGWRPYYRGRWVSLRPYGWTWIGGDPWGWPTHHYGRWGFSSGRWFWIPGRHWGPAWVSWAYATDYVSWCPLGWNNRPVFGLNINIFGGRRYNYWDAWTVVPSRHFHGAHFSVASAYVRRHDYPSLTIRDRAPEVRYAVGRSAVPLRRPGQYAVPRGGAIAEHGGRPSGPDGAQERRFPAPARAPRAGNTTVDGRTASSPAERGERAVSRQRGAGVAPAGEPESTAAIPGRTGAREYSRVPGRSAEPSREPSGQVTEPPAGAVRAVPRYRGNDSPTAAPDAERRERRTYSAGAPVAPRQSPGEVDVYRATPGYRRSPDAAPDDRGRPERRAPDAPPPGSGEGERRAYPRGGAAETPRSEMPSYRSAPQERRGPSGPPPSAAPTERPRGGDRPSAGERPSGDGGSRRRGGDSAPSGEARRRR